MPKKTYPSCEKCKVNFSHLLLRAFSRIDMIEVGRHDFDGQERLGKDDFSVIEMWGRQY